MNNYNILYHRFNGSVGLGCRIHRLHRCRGLRHSQRMSWYDTKQSDAEVPVMLELWGTLSTSSLPSPQIHTGPEWEHLIMVISMGQIELNCITTLNWIVWNRIVLAFNSVWTKTIPILYLIAWNRTVWRNWIPWNRNVFWQLNYVLMLNWIVYNRTEYLNKNGFCVK